MPWRWLEMVCCLAAYLIAGYDVLLTAVRNIHKGRVFDENFLMAVASLGAMAVGEAAEGVMVMLLYQLYAANVDCRLYEHSRLNPNAYVRIRNIEKRQAGMRECMAFSI